MSARIRRTRLAMASSCSRGHAVGRRLLHVVVDLTEQTGDADHEELVEVPRGDGRELEALEERNVGVARLVEHSLVELQPAQLPVDEERRLRLDRARGWWGARLRGEDGAARLLASAGLGGRRLGDCPVGDCPVGDCPVGDWPVGDWLVGDWRLGDRRVGDCRLGEGGLGSILHLGHGPWSIARGTLAAR
ncbi:MAG: hypothetical protein M5U28_56810 [Sandaracinaceae bacterium]|nr:hypothetical protein [Sandaracinaceae bacterium]